MNATINDELKHLEDTNPEAAVGEVAVLTGGLPRG